MTATDGDEGVTMFKTEHTLTPYVHRYLRERKARGTYVQKSIASVVGRLDTLTVIHGRRPLEQLTEPTIYRWIESLDHLADSSRSSYLCTVRTFTKWLVKNTALRVDPCANVPAIRRPARIPRAQPPAAIAAIFEQCTDDRDRAIVWLEVGMGLRRVEVARARWEDYEPETATLLVRGKNDKERFLPVPAEVGQALSRLRQWGNSGPIIQHHQTGKALGAEWIGKRVSDLMKAAGLKHAPYDGVSGHALRHTAASDVLDHCGDLRVVQEMLGHAHLTSTAIYLRRANLGKMREAMEGRHYRGEAA